MDARQNGDVVCYDRDGNIIRVIVTRKRSSSKENSLARKRALAKFRAVKK